MRPAAALAVVLVLAAALAACGGPGDAGGRLPVVATTTQLGDIAREVGGPDARVTQLLRPNTDPHDYEPRPLDVRETAEARLVLESGDDLDHWMREVREQAGADARVLDLATVIPEHLPGEDGHDDPHWWHDPRNARAAALAIARAMAAADPAHAAGYRARGAAYAARVTRLDAAIARCLSAVPAADRKIVTDHDAFGYFARRYGIRIVGAVIPSQTTEAQASAGEVAALVRTIRREQVRAVFPESSVNAKLARAIAAQAGARADLELYGDTLGPRDSRGGTYVGMEQANADAISRGLTDRPCTRTGR